METLKFYKIYFAYFISHSFINIKKYVYHMLAHTPIYIFARVTSFSRSLPSSRGGACRFAESAEGRPGPVNRDISLTGSTRGSSGAVRVSCATRRAPRCLRRGPMNTPPIISDSTMRRVCRSIKSSPMARIDNMALCCLRPLQKVM